MSTVKKPKSSLPVLIITIIDKTKKNSTSLYN